MGGWRPSLPTGALSRLPFSSAALETHLFVLFVRMCQLPLVFVCILCVAPKPVLAKPEFAGRVQFGFTQYDRPAGAEQRLGDSGVSPRSKLRALFTGFCVLPPEWEGGE